MKLVIEPSAGTGMAAVLLNKRFQEIVPPGSNVAVILCGGNIDLNRMSEYMELAVECKEATFWEWEEREREVELVEREEF